MEYIIDTLDGVNINWAAKGVDRIVQNVVNLINTYRYEVAYDRTLGLSGKFIDMPLEQAIAQTTTELYELINEREPRAIVKEVQYAGLADDGSMQFKVVIEI